MQPSFKYSSLHVPTLEVITKEQICCLHLNTKPSCTLTGSDHKGTDLQPSFKYLSLHLTRLCNHQRLDFQSSFTCLSFHLSAEVITRGWICDFHLNTWAFMYPHRKQSQWNRSNDCAGYKMSLCCEMKSPGKIYLIISLLAPRMESNWNDIIIMHTSHLFTATGTCFVVILNLFSVIWMYLFYEQLPFVTILCKFLTTNIAK